ncbi:GntR family transcriptional regulator, partial [[Ruminococcus] gnavus]|nr:GntR family transcriptional regulator [Mediterraneibacter gnavus]
MISELKKDVSLDKVKVCIEEIKKEIFASEYLPGSKLASVRELALEYGVNPNTIQ